MIVLIRNAIIIATLVLFTAAKSLAAEPVVDGGELVGATGVEILGRFYDVQFVDGSCIGLFDNCDNPSEDFTFTNSDDALEAGNALLDQVFVDNGLDFDSSPELTRGCESMSNCRITIPWQTGQTFVPWWADNNEQEGLDRVFATKFAIDADTTVTDWMVYAVFSPAGRAKTKVALKFSEKAEGKYKYVGKIKKQKTPELCWPDRKVTIFHDKNSNEKKNKGEPVIGRGTTDESGRYALRSQVAPPPGDTVSVIIKKNENCKIGRNSRTLRY